MSLSDNIQAIDVTKNKENLEDYALFMQEAYIKKVVIIIALISGILLIYALV